MSVIFAAAGPEGFTSPGSTERYTGAAQARRSGYTGEELSATVISNSVGDTFSHTFPSLVGDGTSGDLWIHFRVKFPIGSASGSADGVFFTVDNDSDIEVFQIEINNGNLKTSCVNGFGVTRGADWAYAVETAYTIDVHYQWSGGTGTISLYVDEQLQSTASGAYNQSPSGLKNITFEMNDMLGVGAADAEVYMTEFIFDDANSTIGCGLSHLDFTDDGAQFGWTGTYTDIQVSGDGNTMESTTGGDISTFVSAYGGPDTGETVRSVVGFFDATTGAAGTTNVTPVARVSGTNFFGTSYLIGASNTEEWMYEWDENPNTTLPWTIANVNATEFGFRADSPA